MAPGAPSNAPPWWAHVVIGAVVIAGGLVLALDGMVAYGTTLIGAGVTFLGVGSGVAASS